MPSLILPKPKAFPTLSWLWGQSSVTLQMLAVRASVMERPGNKVTTYLEVQGNLSCANIKAWNGLSNSPTGNHASRDYKRVPVPHHFQSALLLSQLGDSKTTNTNASLPFMNHQALPQHFQRSLMAVIMIISFIYKALITSSSKAFSKQFPLFNEPCCTQKTQCSVSFSKLIEFPAIWRLIYIILVSVKCLFMNCIWH